MPRQIDVRFAEKSAPVLLFMFTVEVIELEGQPVDGSDAVNVTVYVPCAAQVTVCGPAVFAVKGVPLGNDHA